MNRRKGISNIIAMLLMIALAVAGAFMYYSIARSYLKPQAGFTADITISVGASGFTVITASIVNTGGVPFNSLTITVTGSSSQLQFVYQPPQTISAGGGKADITVEGLSGGPYSAVSSNTQVNPNQDNLLATVGSSYSVVVAAAMPNGATYSQAFSVQATP